MRTARRQSQADLYHVVCRGVGRQVIFEDDSDRSTYLRILVHALKSTSSELYAWCLMSNHVHLLLHAPLASVSSCMKMLSGTYARYFNDKAGRYGHLFQERFLSEPIDDDAYLATVVCYIHENPQKAGICRREEYPWSSYNEYLGGDGPCHTDFVKAVFGGTESFVRSHEIYGGATCLDVDGLRSATRAMHDDQARVLASEVLDGRDLNDLKALPVEARNDALRRLKAARLSIKQIERLTGIGRSIVQRA